MKTIACISLTFLLSWGGYAGEANKTSPDSLRAAIQNLIGTFGNRYPKGKTYLARLDEICKNDINGSSKEFMALQREALIANPLVSDQPLLYVWRNQYKLGGFHAIDTLFHTCEANTHCFQGPGAMRTVDLKTGKVTTLVEAPHGIVRDPCSFRWQAHCFLHAQADRRGLPHLGN